MFEPKYNITENVLRNIKEITKLTTEQTYGHFSDIALYDIEENSRQLSVFSSTCIEGNPLPLTEVKQLLKKKPRNLGDSEQEVINYNNALKEIFKALNKPSYHIDINFICSIQKIVTSNLIDDYRIGTIRKEPVFVNDPRTGKHVYLPPDHGDTLSLMKDLVDFISVNED